MTHLITIEPPRAVLSGHSLITDSVSHKESVIMDETKKSLFRGNTLEVTTASLCISIMAVVSEYYVIKLLNFKY